MTHRSHAAIAIGGIIGGLVALVGVFAVFLFLIKLLWAWTVPDLFPGAVKDGLIAASISWATAAKIALFVAIFSATWRS